MMDYFEQLIMNPSSVTFTALFIGLFVYTMKTNEKREEHYRQTIAVLTESLNECESTKVKLNNLKEV
jgi:hypothetical protein